MKKTRVFIATVCFVLAVGSVVAAKIHSRFEVVYYQVTTPTLSCVEDPHSITGCVTDETNPCTDPELGGVAVYQSIGDGVHCSNPLFFN